MKDALLAALARVGDILDTKASSDAVGVQGLAYANFSACRRSCRRRRLSWLRWRASERCRKSDIGGHREGTEAASLRKPHSVPGDWCEPFSGITSIRPTTADPCVPRAAGSAAVSR